MLVNLRRFLVQNKFEVNNVEGTNISEIKKGRGEFIRRLQVVVNLEIDNVFIIFYYEIEKF